jgi:ABC-type Fe3+-citrate transport system substrate-binding protein
MATKSSHRQELSWQSSSNVQTTRLVKRLVGKEFNVNESLKEHIMKMCHMAMIICFDNKHLTVVQSSIRKFSLINVMLIMRNRDIS